MASFMRDLPTQTAPPPPVVPDLRKEDSMTYVDRTKIYLQGGVKKEGVEDGRNQTIKIPYELGKALYAAGYNRVDWHLTDEGILLKPIRSTDPETSPDAIDLPNWG